VDANPARSGVKTAVRQPNLFSQPGVTKPRSGATQQRTDFGRRLRTSRAIEKTVAVFGAM
jgi:hypothetical protein